MWNRFKDDCILHQVVPPKLIPSYAILATELQRAKRIQIIARYFSVNQLVDYYHTWNLWERIVVLQLLGKNIQVVDPAEHATLVGWLMTLIVEMIGNRRLIAENCGEFFNVVEVLGHFCKTEFSGECLGTHLLKMLARTMVMFQYDFPHLIGVVHGFLVKLRRLITFMNFDINADPEFIENFFILWCDDSAIKKRKLWFIRHLTCQQNVKSVELEFAE